VIGRANVSINEVMKDQVAVPWGWVKCHQAPPQQNNPV
jgi:hypothetical protein